MEPYDLSVVTITYNEAGNISRLLDEIWEMSQKHNIRTQIIIVDDNSPDGTGRIVASIADEHPDVLLITRPVRAGIGSAYLAGIERAQGQYVVTMDADFSHPPLALAALVDKARAGYVVAGSRFLAGSGFKTSIWRKSATRILNFFARRVLRLNIRDYTNGYIAVSQRDLSCILSAGKSVGIDPFRHTLYGVPVFSLARQLNIPTVEVEAPYQFRTSGQSKIKAITGIRLFFETLILIVRCRRALRRLHQHGKSIN